MLRLYLVRHGWTAWHTEGRVAVWSNVPLENLDRPGNWPQLHLLNMTEHLPSFKQGDPL